MNAQVILFHITASLVQKYQEKFSMFVYSISSQHSYSQQLIVLDRRTTTKVETLQLMTKDSKQ